MREGLERVACCVSLERRKKPPKYLLLYRLFFAPFLFFSLRTALVPFL